MCITFKSDKRIILRKPRIVWKAMTKVGSDYASRHGGRTGTQLGFPKEANKCLSYRKGEITVAVAGSPGIFVFPKKPDWCCVRCEVPAGAWYRAGIGNQATVQCVRVLGEDN